MANVPDDWNLTAVGAQKAWKLLAPSGEPRDIVWNGVEVAHLDTGWTNHAVFGTRASTWIQVSDGLNYMEPGKPPESPVKKSAFSAGHGTRTLSVLCGDTKEDSRLKLKTRMGIAPGLPVIPYRVTDTVVLIKKKPRKNIALAIRDAIHLKGVEIITMSMGFPVLPFFESHRHMGAAVDEAYEKGVIVIGAGGQPADRVSYPGKFWRAIGVGGIRANKKVYQKYDQSDIDAGYIDVWGPADEITRGDAVRHKGRKVYRTARSGEDADQPMNVMSLSGSSSSGSGRGDGTSYATVHVAAAAAMWWQHKGDKIEEKYGSDPAKRWQIVEAFRALLKKTSSNIKPQPGAPKDGTGMLDIPALLEENLPAVSSLKKEKRKAVVQKF